MAAETAGQVDPVRALHVAQAFEAVARANHYMVQVAPGYTSDELDAAEQILINRENALGARQGRAAVKLALDLVEQRRRDMRRLTFCHGTMGRHAYEHTAPCIYMRVRTCLELHPGDSDFWCGPCRDAAQQAGKVQP